MKLSDIYIRDPFILPVPDAKLYYLYGTNGSFENTVGFDVYRSPDLEHWQGPQPVFRPPAGFWADTNFWAPEVYAHEGGYIMAASATRTAPYRRGVQFFRATAPTGPFVPHSDGPLTPPDDICIDGTLFWDDRRTPWLIYAHERMQTIRGTICALRLRDDLRQAVGVPQILFTATDAPWNSPLPHHNQDTWCAEGPFLHRASDGSLLLFWSGFLPGFTYALAAARSESGQILGPWRADSDPLFTGNGGHGMAFRTFTNELFFTLHTPGFSPNLAERPILLRLHEEKGRLSF